MSVNKPNRDFDHGYAIIRFDLFHDLNRESVYHCVTVTKVVGNLETAEHEVARLNELNAHIDCRYVARIVRVARRD